MNIKCIFKFSCLTDNLVSSGWSEVIYIVKNALIDADVPVTQLAVTRTALLPATSKLVSTTIGDVENPRAVKTTPWNMTGGSALRTDTPWQSVLLTCSGNPNGVRTYGIRNVPDNVIIGGALSTLTAAAPWVADMNTFRTQLAFYQFAIRVRSKVALTGTVLSITPQGVLRVAGVGWPIVAGAKVQLKNCRTVQGVPVNGIYTVTFQDIAGEQQTIAPWITGNTVEASGTATVVAYDFFPIASADFNRIGTHKVGRPFGGLRGRRSKRRSSRA